MKRILAGGLIVSLPIIISCLGCQATVSGETEKVISDSLAPSFGIGMVCQAYYDQEKKWPPTPQDLSRFAQQNKMDFDLSRYKILSFVPQSDGSLNVNFEIGLPDEKGSAQSQGTAKGQIRILPDRAQR